jgi:hypothetical protein
MSTAALGFLCFIALKPSGITKENWDRIENGMTKEEVIGLFGVLDTTRFNGREEVWIEYRDSDAPGADGYIIVEFDSQDRIVNKTWCRPFGPPPTLSERVIRWLSSCRQRLGL